MPTNYPGALDSFTNPVGTNLVTSPDHANQHTNGNDTLVAIQTTLGTTGGTSVLKNFVAGNFPARINASNVPQQTLSSGTYNNSVIGTSQITGGTFTTGVINTGTLNTSVINTSSFNGGTSGTLVNTGGLTLKDNGSIIQTGTADHISLVPGASKFVRGATYRQDNGTNSFLTNQVEQEGWGYITVLAGSQQGSAVVTLGSLFTNVPLVTTNQIGLTTGTGAVTGPQFFTTSLATNGQNMAFGADTTGTAAFNVSIWLSGVVGANTRFGFTWKAKGSLA